MIARWNAAHSDLCAAREDLTSAKQQLSNLSKEPRLKLDQETLQRQVNAIALKYPRDQRNAIIAHCATRPSLFGKYEDYCSALPEYEHLELLLRADSALCGSLSGMERFDALRTKVIEDEPSHGEEAWNIIFEPVTAWRSASLLSHEA